MRKLLRVLAFLVCAALVTLSFGADAGALFVAIFIVVREISNKG